MLEYKSVLAQEVLTAGQLHQHRPCVQQDVINCAYSSALFVAKLVSLMRVDLRTNAIRAGLEAIYFSGAHTVAQRYFGGVGAILTMHRVREPERGQFQPNDLLEITPAFLEDIVTGFKRAGVDIIDLDEAVDRLRDGNHARRFVVLTFDDGYVDNHAVAWHALRRMKVPFTIYVPTAFPEGHGKLWWTALERIIAGRDMIVVEIDGQRRLLETRRADDKYQAYAALHRWLRGLSPVEQEKEITSLCALYGVDLDALCRELIMNWTQIQELAGDPRVTIGAHSVNHFSLAGLSEQQARFEMRESANVIETTTGVRPRHFSFPYGWVDAAGPREFRLAREEGYATAVTTRPGLLFSDHACHLTALPRVSLNGRFQKKRYVDVLMSGLPTYVYNRFERCNVA